VTPFEIAVLALVQGITEFLPISSHGHLVLVRSLFCIQEAGLDIFIALHVGTLGAVMVYFRRDVWLMLAGLGGALTGRTGSGLRLLALVVVATLPVLLLGFLVKVYAPDALSALVVIGWTTLGFGVLLYIADRTGMTIRRIEHMGVGQALVIGFAQVLALVPGTSRSGITMTAARLLGFERPETARFSLLLSMPTILGAGTLAGLDLYQTGDAELQAAALIATGFAFLSALGAISFMMAWLRHATFAPFVLYRVVLGTALLTLAYSFPTALAC
jgi:undecaprenyl-diphosphatase